MLSRYFLKGRVRGRHYVWVYQGDNDAVGEYEGSGYRYEEWNFRVKSGKVEIGANGVPLSVGVHPPGARPDATQNKQRIKVGDQCLMSCAQQRKADIDEYGHDGSTGQYFADVIDGRLIKHKGGEDLFRGIGGLHSRHARVEEYPEHGDEHGLTTHEAQG